MIRSLAVLLLLSIPTLGSQEDKPKKYFLTPEAKLASISETSNQPFALPVVQPPTTSIVYSNVFGLGKIVHNVKGGVGNLVSKIPRPSFPKIKNPFGFLRPSASRPQEDSRFNSPTDVYAETNMTLCYYLGDDIMRSHLMHINGWRFSKSNLTGLYTYINELTLGTNILLGLHNYKLKWKGPYERSDAHLRYPDNIIEDTKRLGASGCDVEVYLIFNDYSTSTQSTGHKYVSFSEGGPCEAQYGTGYAAIVDQGFYGEVWMGPQAMAHELLVMLTSDLHQPGDDDKFCPNDNSLLNEFIFPGQQGIDQCVVDKLNLSDIGIRTCLLDD